MQISRKKSAPDLCPNLQHAKDKDEVKAQKKRNPVYISQPVQGNIRREERQSMQRPSKTVGKTAIGY